MFSEMTFEAILEDMLGRVTGDVDKREGSVIYDALAPCAYQLAQNYFMLEHFMDLVSGDTAVGEYLDRVVADYGITRKPATSAERKIVTSGEVRIGTRWAYGDTTYIITELLSGNTYRALCEQNGEVGNQYSGALENIDNVNGITAELTDIITSGQDEENDDNLRARLYAKLQMPSTSGNADHYNQWALEVPGVGAAKVFPLWNGNGTVKVLIIDGNMEVDAKLQEAVYEHIEEVRPVGVTLTVDSPEAKVLNINAKVLLDGSKTLAEVKNAFAQAVHAYLKEMIFDTYTISYAKVGSLLLAMEGVEDYQNLQMNGQAINVAIADTEIPVLGTIELVEVV